METACSILGYIGKMEKKMEITCSILGLYRGKIELKVYD